MSPLSVVTGGLGFMGSYMVEELHKAGHRIRVLDLPFEGGPAEELRAGKFLSVAKACKAEVVSCDISRIETLRGHVEDADYLFHIAALFSYTVPFDRLVKINVNGTENLCKLLRRAPQLKRLVVWGSGAVYGIPKEEHLPLTEEAPMQPLSAYGESKRLEEEVAEKYYARGMPVTWIRPTAVYGPRDTRVFYDFFKMIARSPFVLIPQNFTFPLPFVHARDVARAALYLAERPDTNGEYYNVDDNSHLNYAEAAGKVAAAFDKLLFPAPPIPLSLVRKGLLRLADFENRAARFFQKEPRLPRDLILFFGANLRYSNAKLIESGFQFQYGTLDLGLKETLDWYRENGLLPSPKK